MPTKIFLYGSIDLTAICPRLTELEHLDPKYRDYANKSARNGHVYLSVNISDFKEVGTYGDTHGIQCSAKGKERQTLGRLKEFVRDGGQYQSAPPQQNGWSQPKHSEPKVGSTSIDDIPF